MLSCVSQDPSKLEFAAAHLKDNEEVVLEVSQPKLLASQPLPAGIAQAVSRISQGSEALQFLGGEMRELYVLHIDAVMFDRLT